MLFFPHLMKEYYITVVRMPQGPTHKISVETQVKMPSSPYLTKNKSDLLLCHREKMIRSEHSFCIHGNYKNEQLLILIPQ